MQPKLATRNNLNKWVGILSNECTVLDVNEIFQESSFQHYIISINLAFLQQHCSRRFTRCTITTGNKHLSFFARISTGNAERKYKRMRYIA